MDSKSSVLYKEMQAVIDDFSNDAAKWVEKNNKAAAVRARRATKKLEVLGKEFRKASIAEAKA